jgi:hypothetical protein
LGIVIGVLAGLAAQTGMDLLANWLYPPIITDMWDRAQVAAAMAARPTNALLLGVAGYFLGGLIGGWVGKRIWRSAAAAWVPAGLLACMALVIAFGFPIPAWAMFATFAAPLIGGLIANHLVKSRAPDVPEEAAATTDA